MKKIIFALIFLFTISCSNAIIDVKSPCVSTEDGPCGPKRPINDWWLKNSKNPYQKKV